MSSTDNLKQSLVKKPKPSVTKHSAKDLLSTGSTLLNLACTGKASGGYLKGGLYSMPGDSAAGKTVMAMTAFAEASIDPSFKDYRFVFDDSENGAQWDWSTTFSKAMADRIEPARKDGASHTVEEFYYCVDDAVKAGKPFIYVKDSMDSLVPEDDVEKFRKDKKASRAGKDASGSYGMAKAKANSSGLRIIHNDLQKSGSILIILSQTRDKIGGMGFGPQKTRGGGHAQTFYAQLELWFSIREKLKRTVNGKQREIGTLSRIRVKKNRLSGKDRTVDIPIYHSSRPPVSDIDSCVAWLIEEGRWSSTGETFGGGKVTVKDWNVTLPFEQLVQKIQEDRLEKDLRAIVVETWEDLESKCAVVRRNKYEQ